MEIHTERKTTTDTEPVDLKNKILAIINASPDKFQDKTLIDFRISALKNIILYGKPIKWKLDK